MKIHLNYFSRIRLWSAYLIIYYIFSGFILSTYGNTYYVTVTASGTGNGTQSNPYTIWQAASAVQAGDVVYLAKGGYDISSGINFNKSGTAGSPIKWIGTISTYDLGLGIGTTINSSSDGTQSTLIRNITGTSNSRIGMSGSYNEFHNIVFEQDYDGGGSDGKNLINISGDYVKWDSCAFKYPSNVGSSSNHSIYVTGAHVTLGYSSFYNGSRTIIWAQGVQNFIMEYSKLTGASNHPAIQIMPNTTSSDTTTMKHNIVRNCLFVNNSYEDNLYIRYNEQFAVYNNIFINSGKLVSIWFQTGFHYPYGAPSDTCNSKGGIYAFNTMITSSSELDFNNGINQINKLDNLIYTTASGTPYVINFPLTSSSYGSWACTLRHHFDYNLFYSPNISNWNNVGVVWSSGYSWSSWKSTTGQEAHGVINQVPTFANLSSYDLHPLSSSSPQVGAGTPITTANGYWMNITTDYFGNQRDPNHPTIGAIEYITGGGGNNPPNQPSNPNPGNGAINQPTSLTMTWSCSDPNGDPLTYDVYFGTTNNPPLAAGNQTSTSYNPGQLNNSTTYYWKIVAKDNQGASTVGPVWSFITIAGTINNPPNQPGNPNPANGAVNQALSLTLSWTCTDPDGDPLTYDVYFGTGSNPPLVSGNQNSTNYNSGNLNANTIYYWKIVAKDNHNASTSGPVWHFTTINQDTLPPRVLSAQLIDSTELKVFFSEPLEQTSAQTIGNYSITNNISVFGASLSGSQVTLTTSAHSPGNYTVTVINVKDLAGNQIMPPYNTANYADTLALVPAGAEMKIFLEGPYADNEMVTDLDSLSLMPHTQPYNVSPWNYNGNEAVNSIPPEIVDWILIELRSSPSSSSVVSRCAAFVRNDGMVEDLNGEFKVTFPGVNSGSYYVVVYHRNHLAIMSKNPVLLSDSPSLYDFTTSQNKAYGTQPMKSLGNGKYGMYSGDGNGSGVVNSADYNTVWRRQNGSVGYKNGDFDLNGGVNIVDSNAKWKPNKGKVTQVP